MTDTPLSNEFFSESYLKQKYDQMAESYMESRSSFDNTAQLEELAGLIPPHSRVLDLGCGTGLPVAKFFADRGHEVIGVDLSDKMIELARKNVSSAEFYVDNILNLVFDKDCFDLIVSFYCLFHFKKEKQLEVFHKIVNWLRIKGYSYFTLATEEYTGKADFEGTIDFEGNVLPYSHYSVEDYQRIIRNLGAKSIVEKFNIGGETMLWVLVEKTAEPRH